MSDAVIRVFEILGGPSRVARLFTNTKTGKALTPWAVSKWREQVPAERVIELERLTGGRVQRHQLRPDLYPAESAHVDPASPALPADHPTQEVAA